ncbi:MAG: response regulator, partial [Ignavibacteria bacterium]
MIRCIAIDDEPKALDIIKSHVSKIDFLHIADTFTDPFKAIRFIQENPVDLIFLDIKMPDIDGIELIRHLKNKPLIIFTTAHSEYAIRSYELEAVDYLLKPFE